MKKAPFYLFALLATLVLATSCKKDNHETRDIEEVPKTEIPDAYVGKWIIGNVNPVHFSDYNGTRQDDMTNTIAYNLKKDGTAEQYIYIYEEGENKQTLTYRKGTLSFDQATSTLKFNPKEGWYHIFQNGNKDEGDIEAGGLYPTYAPQYRNCRFEDDDNVTYLVATNDYNETVGFAKVNW